MYKQEVDRDRWQRALRRKVVRTQQIWNGNSY